MKDLSTVHMYTKFQNDLNKNVEGDRFWKYIGEKTSKMTKKWPKNDSFFAISCRKRLRIKNLIAEKRCALPFSTDLYNIFLLYLLK